MSTATVYCNFGTTIEDLTTAVLLPSTNAGSNEQGDAFAQDGTIGHFRVRSAFCSLFGRRDLGDAFLRRCAVVESDGFLSVGCFHCARAFVSFFNTIQPTTTNQDFRPWTRKPRHNSWTVFCELPCASPNSRSIHASTVQTVFQADPYNSADANSSHIHTHSCTYRSSTFYPRYRHLPVGPIALTSTCSSERLLFPAGPLAHCGSE